MIRKQQKKRREQCEYDRRRDSYKHDAPPPRRQQNAGPEGPRSYAAGQIEQDYGESRRDQKDLHDDDGLEPQQPVRRRRQEPHMAIGQEGDTNS
jgi:hypothetical protein